MNPYSFTMSPSIKPYDYLDMYDIQLVNWEGIDVELSQVLHRYDTVKKCRSGLLITTTSAKELVHKTRKRTNLYRGNLYIKARCDKYGLWELVMTDTHIKDLDDGAIWFHHKGISAYNILEKLKS
jgi:hypothetical protein